MRNIDYSLIDAQRLSVLTKNAEICSKLSGSGAEIGVYHGGSLIRILPYFKNKKFYAIDTFNGMPEPSEKDLHKKGDYSDVDYNFIEKYLKITYPNVRLIKGFFPDPQILDKIDDNEFCFVHVDVDLYKSTYDCLDYFVPKLVLNGVLINDDYGFPTTPGAKEAVDEYIINLDPENYSYKALPTGQYIIKRINSCQS